MVRVYSLDIGNLTFEKLLKDFENTVHPEVIEKASLYKQPGDKLRSFSSALLLRWALKNNFNLEHPGLFPCSENGKPYHMKNGHEFNISHSRNRVTVATSDFPIGIDVEYLRKNKFKVAEHFFSPYEIKKIENAADKDSCFTTYWCIKESFLKYTGKGLTSPLNSFTVLENQDHFKIKENNKENKEVSIRYLHDEQDYFYAVCHNASEEFSTIESITYNELFELIKQKS